MEKQVSGTNLNPEKITHPFQLMAAWFAMLILLVTALLTAATKIEHPSWAAGFLVISSVVLSIVVMSAVFLMLTAFRPHLQDSKEYAIWLRDERKFKGTAVRALKIREAASFIGELEPKGLLPNQAEFSEDDEDHCQIQVANADGADKVLGALQRKGFNAHIYQNTFLAHESREESTAIWIGYRISPSVVVPAIKAAVHVWPQLRYIHISSDSKSDPPDYIHDELFFGGSTSTANEYGLKPWTKVEVEELRSNLTTSELHELVRAKYGSGCPRSRL
jgi:hypothetical protein